MAYADCVGIRVEGVTYSADSVADYTLMLMLMARAATRSPSSAGPTARTTACTGSAAGSCATSPSAWSGSDASAPPSWAGCAGSAARVLTHDDRPQDPPGDDPLDELLQRSDIVTLHRP